MPLPMVPAPMTPTRWIVLMEFPKGLKKSVLLQL
jgi:hypothetical protein